MRIIGIRRDVQFSPNMRDADSAIFEAVATRLEAMGHEIVLTDDEHAIDILTKEKESGGRGASAVFSMSRNTDVLQFLSSDHVWSSRRCVNPGRGVLLCSERSCVNEAMLRCGILMPETYVLNTTASLQESFIPTFPFWMKRDKGYSQVREDVVMVHDSHEAESALQQFHARGEKSVLCTAHVQGDLVKFYGVAGIGFFDWDYADPSHSKFGLEAANGAPSHFDFNPQLLQDGCERLSNALSTPVYGGDAIVKSDGSFVIIDFNDWPSFSRCRDAAAKAIAHIVVS
ncbi:MAG: hypothetical protein K6F94_04840 [Bacteroidaceae bacterium]|nr:hypothetical protein [Bacteroidaceae bacterium]